MASGSFTGTTNNQYITARVLWSSTSNAIANTSNVTVTLQLMKSSASSSSTYGTGAWTVLINGTTYDFSATVTIPANNTYVTVYTKTVNNISHNNDGTKSILIGWSGGIAGTSYTATNIANTTVNLDTIPRASEITSFSFTNGYIDQGIDITIASKVSTYYHDIHIYLPDTSGFGINLVNSTVGRKAGGTHHINFTAAQLQDIYNKMPTITSSQFTVYVKTYTTATSSVEIGDWQYRSATGNISESVKPSISALTAVSSVTTGTFANLYVQGKTTAKLTCTATMGSGATISSYAFSGHNLSTSSTSNTATSGIITSSGTLTYTVTVTDSRGRKASSTTSITVYPYSQPSFKSAIVNRSNSAGTLDGSGTYAKYTVEGSYSSVGGKNTRTITVAYSSNNGSTYSAETTIQAATNTNATISGVYGSGALSATTSYTIRFTIKDLYGATATYISTLSTVSRAINIKSDNTGIAFGKISEGAGIETPWNMTFKGSGEKSLIFESGSSSAWKTSFYQGGTSSTAVLGAYDVTNNRNIWAYANNGSFYINRPAYGLDGAGVNRKIILEGETEGSVRQLTNVFSKNFPNAHTGYIGIRLGTSTRALNSMITVKGYVTSYHNSTSFEASCYYYSANSSFYGTVATITNPDVLKEVYFAEEISTGYVYLIIGSPTSNWSYPTVSIDTVSIGYTNHTSTAWDSGWTANLYTNVSSFKTLTPCVRGGMKVTLWTGALQRGAITLIENFRNFKFLTCVLGDATSPWGITLGSFLDDELLELHFGAIYTGTDSIAGGNLYGARLTVNSETSVVLQNCGTKSGGGAYLRKIVGWR